MSIADDLENSIFPFDKKAHLYHWDSLVSVQNVIYCIEVFLHTEQEEAEKIFLELASKAGIGIFSSEDEYCYSGVYRPATREGEKVIFDYYRNLGTDWFHWTGLTIMFSIEQIETMMNERIRGHKQPFSIAHLINQKKIQDFLDQPPKEKGTKADRPLHTRERNTLWHTLEDSIEISIYQWVNLLRGLRQKMLPHTSLFFQKSKLICHY